MKRFLTSVSLQHEPKASDVITLVKKTFLRTSIVRNFISRGLKMRISAREACVKPHLRTRSAIKSLNFLKQMFIYCQTLTLFELLTPFFTLFIFTVKHPWRRKTVLKNPCCTFCIDDRDVTKPSFLINKFWRVICASRKPMCLSLQHTANSLPPWFSLFF